MTQPIKVTIQKENAMGEKIEFQVGVMPTMNPQDLYDTLLPMFRALDLRQFEMNQRVLEVNRKMADLSPEAYTTMRNILAGFNNIVFEEPETTTPNAAEHNGA